MEDTVSIQIELMIPRALYKFINRYCDMTCMDPGEFIRSALMYSLGLLLEELASEDPREGFVV